MAVLRRRDDIWLSLTPEPERLLPEARAVLRSGAAPPPPALLERERALAESLVLRARRERWEAWLRESAALAAAGPEDGGPQGGGPQAGGPQGGGPQAGGPQAGGPQAGGPQAGGPEDAGPTAAARALVRDVVANHDALALGLPGAERPHR